MTEALRAVPDRELRALVEGLTHGRLTPPLSSLALQTQGLVVLARHAALLSGLDAEALRLLAEAIVAERAAAPPRPELVWTGPEGMAASARSTAVVFRDLLGAAQTSVWMAGYSIDHGASLFSPLHRAMVERDVKVRFLLNLQYPPNDRREKSIEAGATRLVHAFLEAQWPFGPPLPEIYYDPRTLERRSLASMHAKVVVVDEAHTLIGSANFTQRGQQRNIEAGVLLHDEAFAKQLVTQIQSLVDARHVRRYGTG